MIDALATRIWAHEAFQEDYVRLTKNSVAYSAQVTDSRSAPSDRAALRRLLQSALHLSLASTAAHREAAYRIAVACWNLYRDRFEIRDVTSVVFSRLGIFPAVELLYRGQTDDHPDIPLSLWLELASTKASHTVSLPTGGQLTLTDFQHRVWDALVARASAAVSAPTSAGKSFTLQRYLASLVAGTKGWGLYVVPTRALINQVSASLLRITEQISGEPASIATIPVSPVELGRAGGIYVLTQERLQLLLETGADLPFLLAIIDEAQMVGEGARGVVLESVIERLRARLPDLPLLFGSPYTQNPAVYARIFSIPEFRVVGETESPVAQNLLFLDTDPVNTTSVSVGALIQGTREFLGTVALRHSLYDRKQVLAYLSWVFGRRDKSLVYAGGQAECEEIADKLTQLQKDETDKSAGPVDPLLAEFATFISEHIHPQYLLAESVLHGVGFHYGNMPAIVRKTVEEFFDEGRLAFLVCTSTLLHGVNLPAKNVFLSAPTKGRTWGTAEEIPISPQEFWNLAGRAGRLGRDFEGNVYLIDVAKWQSNPLEGQKYQQVESALGVAIRERTHDLLTFISNRDHPSGRDQDLENSFVKIFNDLRRGALPSTLERIVPGASITRLRIEESLASAESTVTVPSYITERHINVSVYRQQEMLEYLIHRIAKAGPERFIPVHPLRPWEEALSALRLVFKRIHSHFERRPAADKSEFYFAPLALRWMRGEPLARLIEGAYAHKQKKAKRKIGVRPVIRQVMADVEQDL